jgi:hypothetical protein
LISISRKSIKALSWVNSQGDIDDLDVPLPLGNLIEDISKKQFYLNTKIVKLDQFLRVTNYIKSGWKNESSSLLKEKSSKYAGKLCEICHEKIKKPEKVLTLKCGHYFHRDCWYELTEQHINSNVGDIINCPTCRKTYQVHEIL